MKKVLSSVAMLSVCALSLASCASKVSFADFQTKAKEALKKDVEYKTAKITGSMVTKTEKNENKTNISAECNVNGRVLTPKSLTDTAYSVVVTAFGLGTFGLTEITGATYYAGSSFKVAYSEEDEDGNKTSSKVEWNEYGLVTVINAKGSGKDSKATYNLKVSYSK